jgi:hypothetical protein
MSTSISFPEPRRFETWRSHSLYWSSRIRLKCVLYILFYYLLIRIVIKDIIIDFEIAPYHCYPGV